MAISNSFLFKTPTALSGARGKTESEDEKKKREQERKRREQEQLANRQKNVEKSKQDLFSAESSSASDKSRQSLTKKDAATYGFKMFPTSTDPVTARKFYEEDKTVLESLGGKDPEMTESARKFVDLDRKYGGIVEKIKAIEKRAAEKTPQSSFLPKAVSEGVGVDPQHLQRQRDALIENMYSVQKEANAVHSSMTGEDLDSIERMEKLGKGLSDANAKVKEERNKEFSKVPYGQAIGEALTEPVKAAFSLFGVVPGAMNRIEAVRKGRQSPFGAIYSMGKEQEAISQAREAGNDPETIAGKASSLLSNLTKFGVEVYATAGALSSIPALNSTMNIGRSAAVRGGTVSRVPTITEGARRGAAVFSGREAAVQTFEGRYDPEKIALAAAEGAVFEGVVAPALTGIWRKATMNKSGEAVFTFKPGEGSLPTGGALPAGKPSAGSWIPKSVQEVMMQTKMDVKGISRKMVFKMKNGDLLHMKWVPTTDGSIAVQVSRNSPGWLQKAAGDILKGFRTGKTVNAKAAKAQRSPVVVDVPTVPVVPDSGDMVTVGVMNIKKFLNGEFYQRHSSMFESKRFIPADEAEKITRQYFSDTEVSVEVVDRMITPEGERALGKYREGMISFVQNPHESTPDHEAVHAYLDIFAGKEVKDSVLEEVITAGRASNRYDAEEVLADGFVEYVRSGTARGFSRRIIEYFRDVFAKMKGFFGKPDRVRQLYRDIILKRRNSGIETGTTVNKDVWALQQASYQTPEALTLKFLKGITKPEVGQQEIRDLLRRPEVKQAEREVMESVLKGFGDQQKISVNDLRTAVKQELLPLTPVVSSTNPENSLKKPQYEGTTIPENMRGYVKEYQEHVYESPIVHDLRNHMSNPAYFAHTRIEDMADSASNNPTPSVRRVIEIQSDLFQKNEVIDILLGDTGRKLNGSLQRLDTNISEAEKKSKEAKATLGGLSKLPESGTVQEYFDAIVGIKGSLENLDYLPESLENSAYAIGKKKVESRDNKGWGAQRDNVLKEQITKEEMRKELEILAEQGEESVQIAKKSREIEMPKLQKRIAERDAKAARLMGNEFKSLEDQFNGAKTDVDRWGDHVEYLEGAIERNAGNTENLKDMERDLSKAREVLKNRGEDYAKFEAQMKAIKEKQRAAMTAHEKGIMDYRQRWFERIVKEEIRYAALDGKELIQFPTGKTAALVEGFLNSEAQISPENSSVGDEVEYQGMDMVVIEGGYAAESVKLVAKKDVIWQGSLSEWQEGNLDSEIEYAKDSPSDALGIDTLESFAEEKGYTFESKEGQASITDPKAEKKPSTVSMMKDGQEVAQISVDKYDAKHWGEIVKVLEKDGVDVDTWFDDEIQKWAQGSIENQYPTDIYGKDQVFQDGDNIVIIDDKANFEYASVGEGSQYDTVDTSNMDQDYQQAIVDFYDKQVAGFLQKYRKGNIEQIVDEQGVEWWQTKITPEDGGPVEAYQRDVFSDPKKPEKYIVPEKVENTKDKRDPNLEARNAAQQYAKKAGLPPIQETKFAPANPDVAKQIAKIYDEAESKPDDPEVKAAYGALKKETLAQFNSLPVKVEWWTKQGQPYANSREMMEDVKRGVLKVFQGGDPHPILSEKAKNGITYNDMFRAIHDYYGHAANGNTFGANGEENAWIKHSQMFSDLARKAMTTETRGQNSWVNFGANSHLPPSERPFAEQKVFLLPDEFTKRSDLVRVDSSLSAKPFDSKDFHLSVSETVKKYKMTPYTPANYDGMEIFRNLTGTSGYAIKKSGELVSLFNYGTKGAGKFAIVDAIENGATKVTAYAGKVADIYGSFGFEIVSKENNFVSGRPDVVSMILNPEKYEIFKSSNPQLYGSRDAETVFNRRDGTVTGRSRQPAKSRAKPRSRETSVSGRDLLKAIETVSKGKAQEYRIRLRDAVSETKKAMRENDKNRTAIANDNRERIKRELIEELRRRVPPDRRGKFLTAVKNTNTRRQLGKALERADAEAEAAEKQQVIGELKTLLSPPDSVDVAYRQKAGQMLAGIDFSKPTEATTKKLRDRLDFIERDGGFSMPAKLKEQVSRLTMDNVQDMSLQSLKNIRDSVRTMVQMGKVSREMKIARMRSVREKRLAQLLQTTVNLDKKMKDTGRFTPTQLASEETKKNIRRSSGVGMKFTSKPRLFDMADGDMNGKGENVRMWKENTHNPTMRAIQQSYEDTANWMKRIIDEVGNDSALLTPKQQEKYARALAYDQKLEPQMIASGWEYTRPALTEQEEKIVKILQQEADKYHPEIAAIHALENNEYLPKVEKYFPIKYDREVLRDEERFGDPRQLIFAETKMNAAASLRSVEGMLQLRSPGVARRLRTDVFNILNEHIAARSWLVQVEPELRNVHALVNSPEYREKAGAMMVEYWNRYITRVMSENRSFARRYMPQDLLSFDNIGSNLGIAYLTMRLSTTVVQLDQIVSGMSYVLAKYGHAAALRFFLVTMQNFVKPDLVKRAAEESPVIEFRESGDPITAQIMRRVGVTDASKMMKEMEAFEDTLRDAYDERNAITRTMVKWKQKAAKFGFDKFIRFTDVRSTASQYEAFKDLFLSLKASPEEALADAELATMMTNSDASVAFRPEVFDDIKEMPAGLTKETARSVFLFQSFSMNKLMQMWHDIIRQKMIKGKGTSLPRGGPPPPVKPQSKLPGGSDGEGENFMPPQGTGGIVARYYGMAALALLVAGGYTFEEIRRSIRNFQRSNLPKMLGSRGKAPVESDGAWMYALMFPGKQIPVVNSLQDIVKNYATGKTYLDTQVAGATIGALAQQAQSLGKMIGDPSVKNALDVTQGVMSILGVPGTSTMFEIIEPIAAPDEKKKKASSRSQSTRASTMGRATRKRSDITR